MRLCVAAVVALAALSFAAPALSDDYVGAKPPPAGRVDQGARGAAAEPVLRPVPQRSPAGGLPITGGDILGLLLLGAVLVGAGVIVVRRTRSADR